MPISETSCSADWSIDSVNRRKTLMIQWRRSRVLAVMQCTGICSKTKTVISSLERERENEREGERELTRR